MPSSMWSESGAYSPVGGQLQLRAPPLAAATPRLIPTAPSGAPSSPAPSASPAAIPDGTALDRPPPAAVGARHARTQPTEAADVEQATHDQAARVPQGARAACWPDLHLAADTLGGVSRDPPAQARAN